MQLCCANVEVGGPVPRGAVNGQTRWDALLGDPPAVPGSVSGDAGGMQHDMIRRDTLLLSG